MRRTVLSFSIVTLTAITTSLGGGALGTSRARASDIVIVDTLGAATPTTTFNLPGTGGNSISPTTQLVGPQFTLTETTVITEIGGFVNEFSATSLPISVQIRPSTAGGIPHPSKVLATFVISNDGDPLVYSYESASTNLVLKPKTYFALFTAQADPGGVLLASAQIPFSYQAGSTTIGWILPHVGDRFSGVTFAAVRILGHAVGQ
jgi:hypothetical protein